MKNKFLKFLSIILVINLLTPSLVFADSKLIDSIGSQASDINSSEVTGTDISQSQQSEYSDELTTFEDNETKVFATKSSYFSVIIPKKVILDGAETNKGDYSVKVKGDIASNEVVTVEPDTSFAFKQKGKLDVVANVTQSITSFQIGDSLVTESNIIDGVTTTGTVSVDDISAGSWVGTFKFNIALENEIDSEELEPGLYDADGVMVVSWEESGINEDCSNASDIINSNWITKVVIPDSVTSIGEYAFIDCTNLTSITIPDSVTSIGECAFQNCSELTSITIPNSVTSIGTNAFASCSSLTNIVIPNSVTSIGEYAFYNCTNLTSIIIPNSVTSIKDGAFYGCADLTSITIPESVTSIEENVFASCSGLTSITIPDNITNIGNNAFGGCTNLTNIVIPESVTSIGNMAFAFCSGLTTINYEGTEVQWNAITFGDYWNYECPSDMQIIFHGVNNDSDENESSLEAGLYDANGVMLYSWEESGINETCSNAKTMINYYQPTITKVVIPDSVTQIGDFAFYGCEGLISINIPEDVTSIGNNAFGECTNLTSIVIPDSVTSIANDAFLYCSGLTSIVVDENNTHYNSRNNCNAIIETATNTLLHGCKNTIIPDSITSIGDMAFVGCTGLTSIIIPEGVTSIGNSVFNECNLTSITIPESVTSIGEWAFFECTGLTTINYAGTEEQWNAITFGENWNYGCPSDMQIVFHGVNNDLDRSGLYDANGVMLCTWEDSGLDINKYDGTNLISPLVADTISSYYPTTTKIVLPESLTRIGEGAFFGCTSLTSIYIPDSVTSIGYKAFEQCKSLTSVVIPDSVTEIGEDAFYQCTSLTNITIPDSVTNIGEGAFKNCTSLSEIVIPDSVTTIEYEAFFGCTSLTNITIPDSVTNIGEGAFDCCTGLTSIAVSADNPVYDSRNNCNAIIETETNTLVIGCKNTIIPDSVTSIGEGAFGACENLKSIVIPDSVTSIGDYAFYGCTSLSDIDLGNGVNSIGEDAFDYCIGLTSITISAENLVYDSRNNCNAIIETETNTLIIGCKNTIIPDSVTSIGDGAFAYCEGLTSIVVTESVTSIGDYAFYGCTNLTSIVIPESVTSIGVYAFHECADLTIYFTGTEKQWMKFRGPGVIPYQIVYNYNGS